MNSDKFSSNSDRIVDRILSRKVRMVRSLGNRTFKLRYSAPKQPLEQDLVHPEEVVDVQLLEPVAEEADDEISDGEDEGDEEADDAEDDAEDGAADGAAA